MHKLLLGSLFASGLMFAIPGCGSTTDEGESFNEAALKGTLPDGGSCHCDKEKHTRADAGTSNRGDEHGKAGKGGQSRRDERRKRDGGARNDDDEASDEGEADEAEVEARKLYVDGGAKHKKPSTSEACSCE